MSPRRWFDDILQAWETHYGSSPDGIRRRLPSEVLVAQDWAEENPGAPLPTSFDASSLLPPGWKWRDDGKAVQFFRRQQRRRVRARLSCEHCGAPSGAHAACPTCRLEQSLEEDLEGSRYLFGESY